MHWIREFVKALGTLPECPKVIIKHYPIGDPENGHVTLAFTATGENAGRIVERHKKLEIVFRDEDLDLFYVSADLCSALLQALLLMRFGLLERISPDEGEIPKEMVTLQDAIKAVVCSMAPKESTLM